jgi:hypothetical protein
VPGRDHLNHCLHPRVDSTAIRAIAIFLSTGRLAKKRHYTLTFILSALRPVAIPGRTRSAG